MAAATVVGLTTHFARFVSDLSDVPKGRRSATLTQFLTAGNLSRWDMMHVSFLGLGFSRVLGVKTGIVGSDSLVADEVDWRECAELLPALPEVPNHARE